MTATIREMKRSRTYPVCGLVPIPLSRWSEDLPQANELRGGGPEPSPAYGWVYVSQDSGAAPRLDLNCLMLTAIGNPLWSYGLLLRT